MKPKAAHTAAPRHRVQFVILKSYDGGKKWEREQQCRDFTTAADVAYVLRGRHPAIRFRVAVEAAGRPVERDRRPQPRP